MTIELNISEIYYNLLNLSIKIMNIIVLTIKIVSMSSINIQSEVTNLKILAQIEDSNSTYMIKCRLISTDTTIV